MKSSPLPFYFLLAFALPAVAMEVEEIGTIEAIFDGERIVQPTVVATQGDESNPTAYLFRPGAGISSLTISSFAPGAPRITVELMYFEATPAPDMAPVLVAVSYDPPGTREYWTSEEAPAPPRVTFATLDVGGEEGRALGTFSAQLCFAEDYGADADLDNCRNIEGSFETRFFVQK